MKTTLIIGLASCAFLASCAQKSVAIRHSESVKFEASSGKGLSEDVRQTVNNYRASIGKSRLKSHSGLAKLAKKHSEYMAKNAGSFGLEGNLVSHYGFEARSTFAKHKYSIMSLSENVIASHQKGYGGASGLLKDWLNSPNHRNNIESNWVNTGIGVAYDSKGRVYVTQLFGSAKTSLHMVGAPLDTW